MADSYEEYCYDLAQQAEADKYYLECQCEKEALLQRESEGE